MAPARTAASPPEFPYSITINVPFPTARLATTALRALSVDAELSPLVRRSFSLSYPDASSTSTTKSQVTPSTPPPEEAQPNHEPDHEEAPPKTILVTHYTATTNRMLRVSVNGFFESLGVVIACMRELDVDVVGEEWVGEGNDEVDGLVRVQGLLEVGTVG